MPQLRKDPIIRRWVIIATERAKRPKDFKPILSPPEEGECPFCKREDATEVFVVSDDKGGERVRVLSNSNPFLTKDREFWKKGEGPYDLMEGFGFHEVVVETPQHIHNIADLSEEEIKDVLFVYCERFKTIMQDELIKYVLIFKNYGWEAGGGKVRHSRSYLMATPVNLKRVKEELEGAKFYYDYRERCIFCDMIKQEMGEGERVVYENDSFFAFVPFAPRFPFEVWILPKYHSPDFYTISAQHQYELAVALKKVLLKLKILLNDPPYNYIIHTAPFRRTYPGYWTTIDYDYHWHIEITPRLTQVAGFEWGTGFYICPVLPEEAAKFLRETDV